MMILSFVFLAAFSSVVMLRTSEPQKLVKRQPIIGSVELINSQPVHPDALFELADSFFFIQLNSLLATSRRV